MLPYLKAVVAFIAPAAVSLGYALTETSERHSHVTQSEWIAALVSCVLTSGVVYGVPNKDPKAQHQEESVQPPRRLRRR